MPDNNYSKSDISLFDEFDSPSAEQWESMIREELNGGDYREQLRWETGEGFDVLPFYRKDSLDRLPLTDTIPGEPPYIRGSGGRQPCRFAEYISEAEPGNANRAARHAIQNDAGLIHFTCTAKTDSSSPAGVLKGTQIHSQKALDLLLSGIDLTRTGLIIESGMATPALLAMLLNLTENRNISTKKLSVCFLFDPAACSAEAGWSLPGRDSVIRIVEQMPVQNSLKVLSADGLFYHRCGATIIQELAIVLAAGSDYLTASKNPAAAAHSFWMQLSAGSLLFPEIAKFRAVRLLWTRIIEAYGLDPKSAGDLHIHAVTSPFRMAARGGCNNLLRLTTESMAAVTGGADTLTILPFDTAWQKPGEFSRRLSRNMYHILMHESRLDLVADPAGGSYYIEELTDQIAEKAWRQFQQIESAGGLKKSLQSGYIQREVTRSAERRRADLEKGIIRITGVNHFPDPAGLPTGTADSWPASEELKRSGHQSLPGITDPEETRNLLPELQNLFRGGGRTGDAAGPSVQRQEQKFPQLLPSRLTETIE